MDSGIHIGQLNLRIPGKSAEAGHSVANGVAESLARGIPADMHSRLGALNVRVQLAAGAGEAEMSDAIAEAIGKAIQRGGNTATDRQ